MKIQVPDGMLGAALGNSLSKPDYVKHDLEAALRWLSENPILPTQEQLYSTIGKLPVDMCDIVWTERDRAMIAEWQRRMFLAPEPEVPEEIKDLLISPYGAYVCESQLKQCQEDCDRQNNRVIEAFRRGQKAGKK